MENSSEENTFRRPVLLLVVCLLTFIGSGWDILANLFYLFTANIREGMMNAGQNPAIILELEGQSFWTSSLELMEAGRQYVREMVVFRLILHVVSLSGAILMFRLRRSGFYLFVSARILLLFVLPYFAGFHLVVVFRMLMSGVVSFLFIALYALHLKYMNR